MHVVIDIRTATPHFPGIGRYVSNLTGALAMAEPGIHASLLGGESVPAGTFPSVPFASIPCGLSPFSLRQQWVVPRLLKARGATLYHSPYYLMPYLPRVPTVLTCYDLIPLIFPHYFTLWQRVAYRFANKLALRSASRVIAISETTKSDLCRLMHISPERVRAIPLGVDARFTKAPALAVDAVRKKYGLPGRYLLYVGTNKPHKNLKRLVEAWSTVRRVSAPQCGALVIAGYWDDRYPEARRLVEKNNLSDSVRFIGPVEDGDLPALYTGATLFVFPSLYEGFGFPVLEAMACGAPVACSTASALGEVAGDAASLFDPLDSEAIASVLSALLADPDRLKSLAETGPRRAARFAWERTAAETIETYIEAER